MESDPHSVCINPYLVELLSMELDPHSVCINPYLFELLYGGGSSLSVYQPLPCRTYLLSQTLTQCVSTLTLLNSSMQLEPHSVCMNPYLVKLLYGVGPGPEMCFVFSVPNRH